MSRPAPDIAVVTCMRNEGPYVVEWVAHLRALGVSRILAFTNDCEDGTEALLDALAPEGVIHVPLGNIRDARGQRPQWAALGQAWEHPALGDANWLLHMDCDEWLAVGALGSLGALIDACDYPDAIALPWRLFGCDGQFTAQPNLTPERFLRAAPERMAFPALGNFFKTLFRRDGPFTGFGVHRPRQSEVPIFVDDTGRPDEGLATNPNRIILWRGRNQGADALVQLNHYSVRSVHEFLVKTERGLPNKSQKSIDLSYWIERNFNDRTCMKIGAQMPAIKKEYSRLMSMDHVATADKASRTWHRDQLAQILSTPKGAKLCGHLVLAARSVPPPTDIGRVLLAQYQAAQKGANA
ncbi:MAG: glycosyltransferase family 2 protein [Pseudomonadota bacterium]